MMKVQNTFMMTSSDTFGIIIKDLSGISNVPKPNFGDTEFPVFGKDPNNKVMMVN